MQSACHLPVQPSNHQGAGVGQWFLLLFGGKKKGEDVVFKLEKK
jgi:hypothetical protein